ncbi:pentatricopeptide repeat-containing protein At2g22410, mitochondrial-like [Momordica charantia]|uniref:Pentatricopeptide repeat-containing protein At2g22410, mitochondrial-like n=1 Tax=Momordica charantia TaxID=3673 RepID=A0A6J1CGJ2_MOMCH|nr:pentatricopeptide repeat-containing protein At2g22410, mitochondrial-like [Momordica charantia]
MKFSRSVFRLFSTFSETSKSQRTTNCSISLSSIKELHAQLIRTQMHTDPSSISEVIKYYALSPPFLHKAHFVFNQIQRPTFLIWNHMIRGLSKGDRPTDAIHFYNSMYCQGLHGNNLTFIFVFKACARVSDVERGQKVHVHAMKLGFESYLFVSNALIHMYACFGELDIARKMFDGMPERDVVSWNSIICGYCQFNGFKEVLNLFREMQAINVKADSLTIMKVVLACSFLSEWEMADHLVKYIDENSVVVDIYLGNTLIDMYGRRGMANSAGRVFYQMKEKNIVSWNTMIMGYAKVGNLVAARKIFDDMPSRDVISWTSIITGYAQAKQHGEAVKIFQEMMVSMLKPDEITVATVLSACAHLGSLDVGEAVHDYVCKHDIKSDIFVGNALIDMYCKCGVVEKALHVFHEMKNKDSVTWTSIISGLAVNGFADSALNLFYQMLKAGIFPTHGTFVGVLLACAHVGLVDKGMEHFESMEKKYGLTPEMKHYGCIVDLLSRSGHLDKAYEFIKKMPMVPDVVIWRILLSACKLHGNVVLAELVSKKLLELDPQNSGNYVLSSSTYAGSDRWDDVLKIRELMEESDVQKPYAYSSIELNGRTLTKSHELI